MLTGFCNCRPWIQGWGLHLKAPQCIYCRAPCVFSGIRMGWAGQIEESPHLSWFSFSSILSQLVIGRILCMKYYLWRRNGRRQVAVVRRLGFKLPLKHKEDEDLGSTCVSARTPHIASWNVSFVLSGLLFKRDKLRKHSAEADRR